MADAVDREANADPVVQAAVSSLVSIQRWPDTTFISLPLLFPGGSSVTVTITPIPNGYRVSDNGFAYREIESVGAERSFGRTASQIVDADGLQKNARAIYAEVSGECLVRAVCDVATASWRVADRIYSRLSGADEIEIAEYLTERLERIFGSPNVRPAHLVGASTSEWDMTALVKSEERPVIFQAVGSHPNSIYRTTAAFQDLAGLDNPPALVAVVRDKAAMGPRLALISQSARVIEEAQPDHVYLRAAA